jgi:hypothetical protein
VPGRFIAACYRALTDASIAIEATAKIAAAILVATVTAKIDIRGSRCDDRAASDALDLGSPVRDQIRMLPGIADTTRGVFKSAILYRDAPQNSFDAIFSARHRPDRRESGEHRINRSVAFVARYVALVRNHYYVLLRHIAPLFWWFNCLILYNIIITYSANKINNFLTKNTIVFMPFKNKELQYCYG